MPSSSSGDKPVLIVDEAPFDDFAGFCQGFSRLLEDWTWHGNLDAFNDILRGGFGTPDDGFVLQWVNSALSREALGWRATIEEVVEIIKDHGPGGTESNDGVELELL